MKHIGVKILLNAIAMTLGEYNQVRGWEIPEGEDANDEVYLVVYEQLEGEVPNVQGYDGYVSMSPKAVFDAAYTKCEYLTDPFAKSELPHEQRVIAEAKEVSDNLEKLSLFTFGEVFSNLPKEEQVLLKMQSNTMQCYLSILIKRIANFKK